MMAAGQTEAQAHLVGHNGKTLTQQAAYYKANANHALAFLRPWNDIRGWQIVGRHHFVSWIPEPSEVVYHRRLLRNSIRGLRRVEHELLLSMVPHYNAWLCIHSHEGAWTDSGDPYWGGLQMDRSFMTTYGADMIRKYGGYANLWTPLEQMLVAERAYRSGRGFYPWPNTARYCGLI